MKLLFMIPAMMICSWIHAQSLRLTSGGNTMLTDEDTASVYANFFHDNTLTLAFSDQKAEPAQVTFAVVAVYNGNTSRYTASGKGEANLTGMKKKFKKGTQLIITVTREQLQDEVFVVDVE